jgi:hypothetical protein
MSFHSYSCECSESKLKELDKQSYEWSDLVIIGDIIKTGTKYQVQINEVLKGKITISRIEGMTEGENDVFDTCTFYPHVKGKYLLYLKEVVINGKTSYYSSTCLGSRMLNFESSPVSLIMENSLDQLIDETSEWIKELRNRK